MNRVSLDELLDTSRQTAYRDMNKIQQILDSLNRLSMKDLLKGSCYEDYNFKNQSEAIQIPVSDIYEMSFLEYAYHLFDPRLETYWEDSSADENKVWVCLIIYNFFIAFSHENLLFEQFSMISLIDYLDLMEGENPEVDFQDSLGQTFKKEAEDLPIHVNPTMPIYDIFVKVRLSFSNCAFMERARIGYRLFRIVFHDAYEIGGKN